jgi:hypothetical protein
MGMVSMNLLESDYVQTPAWCAKDMIAWFNPQGRILDPCRGENQIFYELLNNADWCEILHGKDFFLNQYHYDWIIGNPPYSIFNPWMKHSYELADNIVYLLPTFKIFNAINLVRMYKKCGWIKHIRMYDVGKRIEWSRSRPIVAVHFQKKYNGETTWSWYG